MAGLTVFVDHCMQRGGVVAGSRGKGQDGFGVARDAQSGGQCADRVKAGVEFGSATGRGSG